jgi:hypothetical protein
MHDRTALGLAEVSDGELTTMVASLLGHEPAGVTLLDSLAEAVSYDLPAITTAGRYWVRGLAGTPAGVAEFTFFVKHVQSWSRSPLFAEVPEEIREMAEAAVPWRTEHLVYRSDVAQHLPDGLSMPRALGVFDLDEKAASIWLESVAPDDSEWDLARFTRAAYLLGRLSGSPAVRPFAAVGGHEWDVRDYLFGRLTHQVLPVLRSEEVWQHPIVAPAFDADLRARLLEAADRVHAYTDELAQCPQATGHGDACPNNLMVRPDTDGFTLIDFGFWRMLPVGFDLGQLLVGDVQIGRRSSDDLQQRDEACLTAYVEGLRVEGDGTPESVVRRAHALQFLIFTGLSILPMEFLEAEPTPELVKMSQERAVIASYSLDLLDATS